jgi:hypothetical protein
VIPSWPLCHFTLPAIGRCRRPRGQRLHLSACLNFWGHF